MKEKTIYESPQIEVVDVYPEKAYCSGGSTYPTDIEGLNSEDSEGW